MIKIGLTGGIGSGKSTVAKVFAELGAPVYYADAEAKKFLKDNDVKAMLVKYFGENILSDGEVDKAYLASLIFNDKSALRKVNHLIHPLVRQDFLHWAEAHSQHDYIIFEVAILFENGFELLTDKTIAVTAPLEERLQRTLKRDGAKIEDVKARMNNQWPQEKVATLADFVIDNAESSAILPQIIKIHNIFSRLQ